MLAAASAAAATTFGAVSRESIVEQAQVGTLAFVISTNLLSFHPMFRHFTLSFVIAAPIHATGLPLSFALLRLRIPPALLCPG